MPTPLTKALSAQIQREIPQTLCRECNLIYCAATGNNQANAVLRIICPACRQTLAAFPVLKTLGGEPFGRTYNLNGHCPYGRFIIISFRTHKPNDEGSERCLANRLREGHHVAIT